MTTLQRLSRIALPPLLLAAALVTYRLTLVSAATDPLDLPEPQRPWNIQSAQIEPRIVTDQQLGDVLDRVKPAAKPGTTNNYIHALRLWGPQADFSDPSIPSGQQLKGYLTDDRVFRSIAGEDAPPLLYRDRDGINVRSFDDRAEHQNSSSHHADDLLATLGEIGLSTDQPLHLREGDATVGDLLAASMRRFHLDRLEYEWSAIVYARYLFPLKHWRNSNGEKISLQALVEELISHPLDHGPCNGLHRLEALAVLYRADEQCHQLPPLTRMKMLAYMKQVSDLLVQSQTSEGYWNRRWPHGDAALEDQTATMFDKILVTGHHLEWLALAPDEVQPPRENIVRAGQWLARTLVELDEQALLEAYGPYSHAARALCLWKQVDPYEAWLKHVNSEGNAR
jgi:hypothetical protein